MAKFMISGRQAFSEIRFRPIAKSEACWPGLRDRVRLPPPGDLRNGDRAPGLASSEKLKIAE